MKHTNKKEGMALVYVVLVMGLLVTMGTSMLFMAEHNNTESNVEVTNEQSYLTAQSGLYAAMDLINQHPDQLTAAAAQLTGTNGVAINPYAEGSQSNLGDLKITMSCDNNTNPCTLVKISSTGTYDGTSRTVSGYFKRKRVVNITDMSPYTYTDENTKNSNDIDNGLVNIADASGDFYDSGDWDSFYRKLSESSVSEIVASMAEYPNDVLLLDCSGGSSISVNVASGSASCSNGNSVSGVNKLIILYNVGSQSVKITGTSNSGKAHINLVDLDGTGNIVAQSAKAMWGWLIAPHATFDIASPQMTMTGGIVAKNIQYDKAKKIKYVYSADSDYPEIYTDLLSQMFDGESHWVEEYSK